MQTMLPRFFAPDAAADATVDLPSDEARHLSRVLRLGVGAEVAVFDGAGREFTARVEHVARAGVRVRIVEPRTPAPEPAVPLTLVQAVLKGEAMDRVVRDAVMMGVAAIQPVATEHGQVRLSALERGGGAERWRRVAVASAKQCRRAVVPAIRRPRAFRDVAAETPDEGAVRLLLVEPGLETPGAIDPRRLAAATVPHSAMVAVGSEGGWSAVEVETSVAQGWLPISLGRRTLRADAVPVAAIAVLRYCWNDL